MAGKYSKLMKRFWTDADVRALSDEEKLATVYMMNRQANRIGYFSFSCAMAAEDLSWDLTRFRRVLGAVCERLGWHYDEVGRVLFIPSWWKSNPPENESHFKGCLTDLDEAPESHLRALFLLNETDLIDTQKKILAQVRSKYPDTSKTPPDTIIPTRAQQVPDTCGDDHLDILTVTVTGTVTETGTTSRAGATDDDAENLSPEVEQAAGVLAEHSYLGRMLNPAVTLVRLRASYPELDLVLTTRRAAAALTPEREREREGKRGGPDRWLTNFFAIAERDRVRAARDGTGGGLGALVTVTDAERRQWAADDAKQLDVPVETVLRMVGLEP